MNFPCPLLLTSVHFSIQWIFAYAACSCFPETLGTERVELLTWKEWARISVPCGLVTALDVGLSNLSLVRITLTFYTMVKSSTPVFVLGWAYIFKLERITLPLVGVILIIAAGELLTVYGEVEFDPSGFILCLLASVLSGLRWTLVQTLLQNLNPPLESTIVTMKVLAPSMFSSMFLLSMIIERPWNTLGPGSEHELENMTNLVHFGLLGGCVAIAMILCEFSLILRASAIILMIGGVVKELVTITIGVTYFKDKLNLLNSVGVFIVFCGVASYKVVFHMQKKQMQAAAEISAVPTEDIRDEEDRFEDNFEDDDDEILGSRNGSGEKAEAFELVKHRGIS